MSDKRNDDLGDRIKEYEIIECGRKLIPRLPLYARIDGRCFSKFTKGMDRPFDENFYQCMLETTKYLVSETQAEIGYFQSDEISLCWKPNHIPFNGKIFKIMSVLSGMASSKFTLESIKYFEDKTLLKIPHFDCRIFSLPSESEVANAFVWRNLDCAKNAISQVASTFLSHNQLHKLNSSQKQELLFKEKGINFNDIGAKFKRGTWIRNINIEVNLSDDELNNIPEKHRPSGPVIRSKLEVLTDAVPPFNKVINKTGFIFNKEQPIKQEE